jgi:hypothetical protein
MTLQEAKQVLREYHLENDQRYLYVRVSANSAPTKLKISWHGTVSDKMVEMLRRRRTQR